MQVALELIAWFKHETKRVYQILGESDSARIRRRFLDWIESNGGLVTIRTVQQGSRRFDTAEDAERALQELVNLGLGYWKERGSTKKGGRPTREFILGPSSTSTESPQTTAA